MSREFESAVPEGVRGPKSEGLDLAIRVVEQPLQLLAVGYSDLVGGGLGQSCSWLPWKRKEGENLRPPAGTRAPLRCKKALGPMDAAVRRSLVRRSLVRLSRARAAGLGLGGHLAGERPACCFLTRYLSWRPAQTCLALSSAVH